VVARGEIWRYEPPNDKPRPYLILTRSAAIDVLAGLNAAAVTTTIRGLPTELLLDKSDGMPTDCVITFDNIATIQKIFLVRRMTTLSSARMAEVCDALRFAIDC
jgi:mRNA interferase MazF